MNALRQLIEDCRSVGIEIPEKPSESDYEVLFAIQAVIFLQTSRKTTAHLPVLVSTDLSDC